METVNLFPNFEDNYHLAFTFVGFTHIQRYTN